MITRASTGVDLDIQASPDSASCFIETKDMDLGRQDVMKFLRRFIADIRFTVPGALSDMTLVIRHRNDLSEALIDEAPISMADTPREIHLRVQNSRFFRFRITDAKIKDRWKLVRMEIFGSPAGRRW